MASQLIFTLSVLECGQQSMTKWRDSLQLGVRDKYLIHYAGIFRPGCCHLVLAPTRLHVVMPVMGEAEMERSSSLNEGKLYSRSCYRGICSARYYAKPEEAAG